MLKIGSGDDWTFSSLKLGGQVRNLSVFFWMEEVVLVHGKGVTAKLIP